MRIALSTDSLTDADVDLLVVGVRSGKVNKDEAVKRLDRAMGGALAQQIKDEDFSAKSGEVLKVPGAGRIAARWVGLVGLGDGPAAAKDGRLLGTAAARCVRKHRSLAVVPPVDDSDGSRCVAEGIVTGLYRYTQYLTGSRNQDPSLRDAFVLCPEGADEEHEAAVEEGRIVGEAVNLCRDLVNAPPNDLHPPALADVAKQHARAYGVSCRVWDQRQIENKGMHLMLAVSRGSAMEPRFIDMHYRPKNVRGKVPRVVFVGKGLTFDSGGLCVKPPKGMIDMKCDMAGAAVTIAVVLAAARLGLPVEVRGLIGAAENMSGDYAYRPGDVFPSLDGKSVEIINTDAEGRLVMADVLAYARGLEPDYLVDHATLTGACMVALGPWTAGLFSNDDELAQRYRDAAEAQGESYWRMPLTEDLVEGLKSDVADLKHTGEAQGGAISAALFLREFVGQCTWAHLDIAGPAHIDRPHGVMPKGGTGFGVATAVRFLESLIEE